MAKEPLDWSDPAKVRIQQESRVHFSAPMTTFELIVTVCTDEADRTDLLMTLTQINAAPTQGERGL